MTPVIPCSTNSVTLFQGSTSVPRKHYQLTRSSFVQKSTRKILSSQCLRWPQSTSISIFPKYRSSYVVRHGSQVHILAATGTEVAVEEPSSAVAGEAPPDAAETAETPSVAQGAAVAPSAQSKRPPRPARKSDMPPVKNEELVPGATFTGKVRSIQPFGAFVDFGAFTDGLVHVSQLTDNFVKDVGDVVSIGQEVKVKLVEANLDSKRISLTMRLDGDVSKLQQRRDSSGSTGDKSRPGNRANQKTTKLVKGQDLQGTVKNLNRAGAFITLPDDEEGFLPTSEEYNGGFESMIEGSSLNIGEEVSVRVLRITRGKVTLTMKKEEDIAESNSKVIQGVVHVATNPFAQAFRQNKDIAAFLDESQKSQKPAQVSVVTESPEVIEEKISKTEVSEEESSEKVEESSASAVDDVVKDDTSAMDDVKDEISSAAETEIDESSPEEAEKTVEASVTSPDTAPIEPPSVEEKSEDPLPDSSTVVDTAQETLVKEVEAETTSEILTPEESVVATGEVKEDVIEPTPEPEVNVDQTVPPESVISEEVQEDQTDETVVKDELQDEPPSTLEKEISPPVENEEVKVEAITSPVEKEEVKVEPTSSPTTNEDAKVEPTPSEDISTKASISPALVKSLRDETGAGMMDCKKALAETGGDIVKAQEFLRKKGLASADKKASRVTAEGRIGSYIHDSRIGVLIEVNCETDFVSRGDIFKELVDDLAMQVAACPQVQYLVTEDVSEDLVNKEREIEMQKEDLLSKPEQIRSKIVEGRIRKRLEELALLEQPYIKNDKMIVKDWVKQTIATIGENIKVKRFVRYNLGEGLEKKSQDFAAEVAAQTSAKPSPVSQPAAVETKEAEERPKVAISAALVKELREETGAGMMDCKKALAETGGDLEKAQEYLRKKGLSSADKKSSRLAAEGRIGSYIHDARIGVLIEVNSETDFVGRSEKFKELVDDLAMQVVACPLVEYVSVEDIPESIVAKEKELEMQREDLQSKPVNIREKIVEGRISKRLGQLALLEQPFIKDDSVLVKDLVKNTVAAIGENIKVRRFVRFTLGEATEDVKETTDA